MARTHDAATRYINRELSWLDFNARVLDLAADGDRPAPGADQVLLDLLRQPGRVLHGAGGRARGAGLLRRSPCARPTDARRSRRWPRSASASASSSPGRPASGRASCGPRSRSEGIVVGGAEDCNQKELAELTSRFEREIYPVLTPLAVGPGQPFPYISPLSLSLAVFVRDPDSGEERFARVKVPEAMPRYARVGRRGIWIPLERVISHFLSGHVPADGDRRARGLPRHARRRLRGLGRGRRPARGRRARAAAAPLRRRRTARGVVADVERDARAAQAGARTSTTRTSTRSRGRSTSPSSRSSSGSTGPTSPTSRGSA